MMVKMKPTRRIYAGSQRSRATARINQLMQMRAERPVALIPNEEEGHRRIADERLDVLDDPPASDHPVGGDDHERSRRLLDRERLLLAVGHDGVRIVDRRVVPSYERPSVFVEIIEIRPIHIAGFLGHRRIEVERQVRDGPGAQQPVEPGAFGLQNVRDNIFSG